MTSTVIGGIIQEQDHRLLEERTEEVTVFLESMMREIELTFPFLGAALQLGGNPIAGFPAAAQPLVQGPVRTVGLAQASEGTYTTLAVVGAGDPGPVRDDDRAALLRRATREGDLVTAVLSSSKGTLVGLAYAQRDVPFVLFQEILFDPPNTVRVEEGSPFSDLVGAVYAGRVADPSHLVLTTTDTLPLEGDNVVRRFVDVGADEWLLVATSAPRSVSLAGNARWGVLIGGALIAVLTASLVEMLSRRRAYALRLVAERTAELRASLAEQAKLEQGERQAREAAEAASVSKSEFLSRMSHELRTPLNAVLGFAQLLELDDLEEPQRESVDQILKGGRHLLNLINEVLDITRIETGSFALSPEPVATGDAVRDVLDLMRPLAQQHGVQLDGEGDMSSGHFVLADAQRLRQVLLNLVANAIKYNRAGGSVSVTCAELDGAVRIAVRDTGPGIAEEQLPLLFTPFERLGAENTDIEGTGVGLALSRRLTEAMGGTLTVDTAVGRGSTFSVHLPRADDPLDDEMPTVAALAPPVPSDREAHKILYIEDNLSNLRLIERLLAGRRDVELLTAGQGGLGVDLARQHRPSVILLDLHLPDINGDQVLQQLQTDPLTAETPIIMISADATAGQVERLVDAGARAYLTKPLDVRALLDLLDELLEPAERVTQPQ